MSTHPTQDAVERRVFTVSELNRSVRMLFETNFPMLWLVGELSNLARPASGHLYFSLKDANAQIRCALFRNRSHAAAVALTNGQQVTVRARLSLYEPRGDYQLIVEHIEDSGEGALRQAFDALKRTLADAGLFDVAKKRALPQWPRRIGVITSASGAALQDVLSVLERRAPQIPVLVHPVAVQGDAAVGQICNALATASGRADCDVLMLIRGGGSLEDLQAFNDERVARAIAACTIPLVSGVGHETDVTIADFVADVRAPTPSAAAELISPDREQLLQRVKTQRTALSNHLQRRLNQASQSVDRLSHSLRRLHPQRQLREHRTALSTWRRQLVWIARTRLNTERQRAGAFARALHTLSPLPTLSRGYAIVREQHTGTIVRDASTIEIGAQLTVNVARGTLVCQVCDRKASDERLEPTDPARNADRS